MKALEQIRQAWERMHAGQRIAAIIIAGIAAAGVISLPFIGRSADFAVLYGDLDPENAGKIVSRLKESNVRYRLAAGGRAIMVPAEQVYDLRLDMAMNGLPGGVAGFELFDKNALGMSDFVQQLNHQRALQGELSRTIAQLEGVEQARVHLAIPRETVFIEDKKEATASVVLRLRPGWTLTKRQVAGILHLVANSIEGLSPSNVTVIDTRGGVLASGRDNDSVAALSGTQFELTQGVEKYLEGKVQTLMDRVVGPGRSVVRVSAELNFEQKKIQKETFDPDNVLRSEQTTSVSSRGMPIPGEIGAGGGTYSKDETISNYEVGKTVQQIVSQVGDIKRLSIALVVDGTYQEGEGGRRVFTPRTEQEIRQYTELARQAVNFNASRGDMIQVQNIPFDTTYEDEVRREMAASEGSARMRRLMDFGMSLTPQILVIVGIAVLLLLGSRMLSSLTHTTAPSVSHAMAGAAGTTAQNAASVVSGAPSVQQTAPPAAARPGGGQAQDIAEKMKKLWLS